MTWEYNRVNKCINDYALIAAATVASVGVKSCYFSASVRVYKVWFLIGLETQSSACYLAPMMGSTNTCGLVCFSFLASFHINASHAWEESEEKGFCSSQNWADQVFAPWGVRERCMMGWDHVGLSSLRRFAEMSPQLKLSKHHDCMLWWSPAKFS